MGRNNNDFAKGLFHGTNHPFEIGDIILPTSSDAAYATHNEEYAQQVAEEKAEQRRYENPELHVPKIYRVEPVDPEEVASRNVPGFPPSSQKGFRVIGLHKQLPARKALVDRPYDYETGKYLDE